MDWKANWREIRSAELREQPRPNPALKGKRGGNCNRTACQNPGATWYNATMQAWYCPSCARGINEGCPPGKPICVPGDTAGL